MKISHKTNIKLNPILIKKENTRVYQLFPNIRIKLVNGFTFL